MKKALCCALVASAISTVAIAGPKDDTLNVMWKSELTTLDRFNSASPEINIVQHLVFDNLIYRDPDTFQYKPSLATKWKFLDDKTLELSLRSGVKFHNGEAFDADDVVATIKYITDPDNPVVTGKNTSWIAGAEKVDALKVLIKMKTAFPAAIEYLAGPIPMYPNEYLQKVGKAGFGAKPVGTGPYTVVSTDPGRSIVFQKNPNYWSGSPKGKAKIGRIVQRTIPDATTQAAEILAGSADWMWRVPEDQARNLGKTKAVTVQANETMRIGFLLLDAAGRSGNAAFKDVRVRRAVAMAIDRNAIAKKFAGKASRVVHTLCFPLQFGCSDSTAAKYEYNPKKAKKLLADAGYAKGFEFDIYTFSPFEGGAMIEPPGRALFRRASRNPGFLGGMTILVIVILIAGFSYRD